MHSADGKKSWHGDCFHPTDEQKELAALRERCERLEKALRQYIPTCSYGRFSKQGPCGKLAVWWDDEGGIDEPGSHYCYDHKTDECVSIESTVNSIAALSTPSVTPTEGNEKEGSE
jgi:hypothetical protein